MVSPLYLQHHRQHLEKCVYLWLPPSQIRGKTVILERAQWGPSTLMIIRLKNLMHENVEESGFIPYERRFWWTCVSLITAFQHLEHNYCKDGDTSFARIYGGQTTCMNLFRGKSQLDIRNTIMSVGITKYCNKLPRGVVQFLCWKYSRQFWQSHE